MLEGPVQSRDEPPRRLSPREREVLAMIAMGLSNTEIAGRLHVTVHAVKFHLAAIYRKLEVSNRTEAAVTYLAGDVPAPADSSAARANGGR